MIKDAKTKYEVSDILKKRWSPRAFSDKKLSHDIVYTLFEAAAWSASSRNEQPWRFIYGLKDEGENYKKIFDTLVPWNQKWAYTAQMLIITVAKSNFDYHNQPNGHAWYDVGQAMATMSFQATTMGIYVHQMGGFDQDLARSTFNIPADYEPVSAVAVGYLGKPDVLPEEMYEQEVKERTRFSLDQIIFEGDFKP